MHRVISANQIRAARVFLDWSQDQLAETSNLGKSTIRNLEAGYISLHSAAKVRKVFELNGLEFTEGDGIRRRSDGVRLLKSPNGCDEFLRDVVETVSAGHDDVLIVTKNEASLLASFGVCDQLDQLELLGCAAAIKCLFLEADLPTLPMPSFEFRIAPQRLYPKGKIYYIYGSKLALVSNNGPKHEYDFVLINSPGFAESWREEFLDLWEISYASAPASASQILHHKSQILHHK